MKTLRAYSQTTSKATQKQRGVAIIEFTITLPLLLLLMLGGAEVGRMLYQYNTLTKAVEDGARYLAGQVRAASSNGGMTTVTDNAVKLIRHGTTDDTQPSLLPGTVSVTTLTNEPAPNQIVVTASYTYDPMIFPTYLPGFGLWNDILLARTLTAKVEMPIL